MGLSPKALQKKRAKKKSKRQIKAPHSFSSSTINYNHWPVGDCWVTRIMKTLEQNNETENYNFMIEAPETRELLVEEEV